MNFSFRKHFTKLDRVYQFRGPEGSIDVRAGLFFLVWDTVFIQALRVFESL